MKLEIGKTYRIEFISSAEESYITVTACYEGIETDSNIIADASCVCCGRKGHTRLHKFSTYYKGEKCETFYMGTSCFNNCIEDIVEVSD